MTAMNVAPKWSACATSASAITSPGQDGKEHVHPPKGLGVSQRASCEQAPVLGGEDLQLSRRRFGLVSTICLQERKSTCIVRPFI